MRVRPDLTADGGYWISDDRVYAFVGSAGNAIAEVGYHGLQPVSRNSRIFAGANGVCGFTMPGLKIREYDWLPGSVGLAGIFSGGEIRLRITASGRRILITGACTPPGRLTLEFRLDALFTEVHGTRLWERVERTGSFVSYRCRDRIFLDEWMKRQGPYAGDFLIPEPMRRTIFRRPCRSGLATKEDLLPEYQNAHIPIYDAEIRSRIGGEGYAVSERDGALVFEVDAPGDHDEIPPFSISFDEATDGIEGRAALIAETSAVRARHERRLATTPALHVGGLGRVGQFFSTVPALVDSAIVQDLGIPRATPGRYYWIWAWDALVTAGTSLLWGATELANSTAAFIDDHRDQDGRIPMRWTRDLQPLDTQDPGSLDVLLYALAYSTYLETRDATLLTRLYPRMIAFLDDILARSDPRGCFANIGFYPDLPLRFHRTTTSAVAMEVASFYTFCRICENVSRVFADGPTASRAATAAAKVESSFLNTFWDTEKHFYIDAVDLENGVRNTSYPLFTLLFLFSPLGLPLLRSRMKEAGEFISRHHCTPFGLKLLPAWDRNAEAETVAGSWYPHWDMYALSVLRRAGRSAEIIRWLRNVDEVLARLGYAPEFLLLDGLSENEGWLRHGAASNLNCVTGWYRGLIGGLCGLERDPGGMTVIPLNLPLGRLTLSGIRSHGASWDLEVDHGGPFLESLRVDGEEIRGCLKIPARYHDGGEHLIELRYGTQQLPVAFSELTNAEVVEVLEHPRDIEVVIRAVGSVDVVIAGEHRHGLSLDGALISRRSVANGSVFRLDLTGEHVLCL